MQLSIPILTKEIGFWEVLSTKKQKNSRITDALLPADGYQVIQGFQEMKEQTPKPKRELKKGED